MVFPLSIPSRRTADSRSCIRFIEHQPGFNLMKTSTLVLIAMLIYLPICILTLCKLQLGVFALLTANAAAFIMAFVALFRKGEK